MATRTGNFPIGFRRPGGEWQRDIAKLAAWAKSAGFDHIDLGRASAADVNTLTAAGLSLGSVDLVDTGALLSPDEGRRKNAVEANVAYVKETAALGAKAFFTCVVASDASKGWKANYKLAVESFGPIVQACADTGGAIAIEGWPGGYPFYSNLCCTPETVRAFIRDLGPKGVGLNYDPSHLIRLGVDHVRFLREFAPYVHHVHGKDAETDKEWLYELGYHYHSIEKPGHGFGEWTWRYTVPGHGEARWSEIFRILKESGYAGKVSIELEDEQFNGSTEGEQAGLAHSLNFLQGA